MRIPVLLVGAGGHAKVLIDALLACSVDISGIITRDPDLRGDLLGVKFLGTDNLMDRFPPSAVQLVNGVGSVRSTDLRRDIFKRFKAQGYRFASVVHPSAVVGREVRCGEGVQIMAGVVIQSGSDIGDDVILNTRSSVDHDCQIGAHVHIAPGATLSGGVKVGADAHIGTGAVVMQSIVIGQGAVVGAGGVVVRDVAPGTVVYGVPAREKQS
jgi:sugar O-acyltransferase (sialic acid O-acetyltransferase NeuD family)